MRQRQGDPQAFRDISHPATSTQDKNATIDKAKCHTNNCGKSPSAILLSLLACICVTFLQMATVQKSFLTRMEAPLRNVLALSLGITNDLEQASTASPSLTFALAMRTQKGPIKQRCKDGHFDFAKNADVLEAVPSVSSASLTSTAGLARTPSSSSQTLSSTHPFVSKRIRKLIGF